MMRSWRSSLVALWAVAACAGGREAGDDAGAPDGGEVEAADAGREPDAALDLGVDGGGAGIDRVAGVLVFAWYRAGAEHATGQLHSTLGLYDSRDPEVQAAHLAWWEEAGVNLAAFSWWGIREAGFYRHIDAAVEGYARTCEEGGMPWAIFWEATSEGRIEADLARIAEWATEPHYLRRQGKPVLFAYHRLYELRSLADDAAFWNALVEDYYVVFDKVPDAAIPQLPAGSGYTYWDLAFTAEEDVVRKYELAAANTSIGRALFVNHGFDNRGLGGRVVWPDGVGGYATGSSVEWLEHQYELATSHAPDTLLFPWNELGEHSAFEPTDPTFGEPGGGFGDLFYEQMKILAAGFLSGE